MFARSLLGLAVLAGTTGTAAAQLKSYFDPGFTGRAPHRASPTPPARMPSPARIASPAPPRFAPPVATSYAAPNAVRPAGFVQPAPLPPTVGGMVPPAPLKVLPDVAVPRVAPPEAALKPVPQPPVAAKAASQPAALPPLRWCDSPHSSKPPVTVCEPCTPPGNRVWGSAEWLYWTAAGQNLPPLATASPVGTAPGLAGVLVGGPNTVVLFGDSRENNDFRNGLRATAGGWLNGRRTLGLEGDFFFLEGSRAGFATASNGTQILARPLVDFTGQPASALVSFPGTIGGSLVVDSRSDVIGGGVNGLYSLRSNPTSRLNLLVGYRFLNLRDELEIGDDLTTAAGVRIQTEDRFRTDNDFHGGLIGLSGEHRFRRVFIGARASVALGSTRQTTEIGGTTITPLGTVPFGLLSGPAVAGRYEESEFAVLPELGVKVGVKVTEHARVFAGYNYLYLGSVARAGAQVNLRLGQAYTPRSTDFYMHGVSFGGELRY